MRGIRVNKLHIATLAVLGLVLVLFFNLSGIAWAANSNTQPSDNGDGNIILAGLVPAVRGQDPVPAISKTNVYWASMQDFTDRHLSIDFNVDSFFDLSDVDIDFTGVISTNGVEAIAPFPIPADDGLGGKTFTMEYFVPVGVQAFNATIYATAVDIYGDIYEYPGPYPGS